MTFGNIWIEYPRSIFRNKTFMNTFINVENISMRNFLCNFLFASSFSILLKETVELFIKNF